MMKFFSMWVRLCKLLGMCKKLHSFINTAKSDSDSLSVSLQHRRARRCHGHWGVKFCGVNDKAELIVIGIIYFSTKIQEHKQYMLRFFMGNTVHIHMVYGRRRNCVSTRLFSISPPQHFYRQLLAFLAVAQQHHGILQVTATLWVSELKEEGD